MDTAVSHQDGANDSRKITRRESHVRIRTERNKVACTLGRSGASGLLDLAAGRFVRSLQHAQPIEARHGLGRANGRGLRINQRSARGPRKQRFLPFSWQSGVARQEPSSSNLRPCATLEVGRLAFRVGITGARSRWPVPRPRRRYLRPHVCRKTVPAARTRPVSTRVAGPRRQRQATGSQAPSSRLSISRFMPHQPH